MSETKSRYFCDNGCPYGAKDAVCFLQRKGCPIDELYQELKTYKAHGERCVHCSNARVDPTGRYISMFCGQCPKFCPACDAPREREDRPPYDPENDYPSED